MLTNSIKNRQTANKTSFFGTDNPTKIAPVPIIHAISMKVSPPGSRSRKFLEWMKKVIGTGNYVGLYGITIVGGEGAYIVDLDGNVYLDCLADASRNVLGYNHQEVAREYYKVTRALPNSCFPYSFNPQAVELAENLLRIVPGEYAKKVLLGASELDSRNRAIEIARKHTHKPGVIELKNDCDGFMGQMQATSGFITPNLEIHSLAIDSIGVNYPVTLQQKDEALREIERLLDRGQVGAVMAEPIRGDAVLMPYPGFFSSLREILDKYRAVSIVDEVQSGMGRTGKWWAIEHENVVPDILITARILASGYAPISATIARAEIIDALTPARYLFACMGYPPSAAAASRVIRAIEQQDIIANAATVGERILAGLKNVKAKFPQVISDVRGKGLTIGTEIDTSLNKLAGKIFALRCVEKGVYLGACGIKQNVLRIEPPLIITRAEADLIVDTIYEVAEEMQHQRIPESTIDKIYEFAI